jgi:hypothetical protein
MRLIEHGCEGHDHELIVDAVADVERWKWNWATLHLLQSAK